MFIFMFLSPGKAQEQLYPGQVVVQVILLFLAFIQVPIILFFKPLYLHWEHNHARALGYRGIEEWLRMTTLEEDSDLGEHVSGSCDNEANEGESAAIAA
jgi:V-type H+-transporting ATPase subunit a